MDSINKKTSCSRQVLKEGKRMGIVEIITVIKQTYVLTSL